jgi:hypothetical protein
MLFRERLSVPLAWWVLAALLTLTMLVVVGFYLGPAWGIGVAVVTLVVATALLTSTAVLITVDADELRVGRAVIERAYIGGCRALDAEATVVRGGVQADGRAHLVLKPYVATAVEIELDDPDDPVPYWLVSSRRPARLAAALAPVTASGPVP